MAPLAEKKFLLRLPGELHDLIERLAKAEMRSIQAEIIVLLKEALVARGLFVEQPLKERVLGE